MSFSPSSAVTSEPNAQILLTAIVDTINHGLAADVDIVCTVRCTDPVYHKPLTAESTSMVVIIQALYPSFHDSYVLVERPEGVIERTGTTRYGFTLTTNGKEVARFFPPKQLLMSGFIHNESYYHESTGALLSYAMEVRIDGVAVNFSVGMLHSGSYLELELPSYDYMCGRDGCSETGTSFPLEIWQATTVLFPMEEEITVERGMSCPPHCPNGGDGVQYLMTCQDFLVGNECFDPDYAQSCAFGGGSRCFPCPKGAVCPGM